MKRKEHLDFPPLYYSIEKNQEQKIESSSPQNNNEICNSNVRAESVSRQLGSSAIDLGHKAYLTSILEDYTRNHRCSWPDACRALGIEDPDDFL